MKRSRSASGAPGTSSKCSVNGFYLVLPTAVSKAGGLGPWEVAVQRKVCLNSSFHAGLMPLVSTDFLLPHLLVHCFPAGHEAFCVSVTHRGCFSHSRCCCSKSGNCVNTRWPGCGVHFIAKSKHSDGNSRDAGRGPSATRTETGCQLSLPTPRGNLGVSPWWMPLL